MTMTNEQIQALKAAAESVIQTYGDDWFETGSQICTLLKSKVNFIAAANPSTILSLLAECEADKALIAKMAKLIAEMEFAETEKLNRIAELEARTLTVKFPSLPYLGSTADWYKGFYAGANGMLKECVTAVSRDCAAAGITLKVGGEDAE